MLVLAAAFVAASLALFVFPRQDHPAPRSADAVVVLSGTYRSRLVRALALMRAHVAPVLVISGGSARKYGLAHPYCRRGRGDGFRVLCFDPHPNSTRGEAEEAARLARAHGWNRIVVVSSTYHLFRARLLFRRCTDAAVQVVAARPSLLGWTTGVPAEWPKLALALTTRRGC